MMIDDEIMREVHKDDPKMSLVDKLLYCYIYLKETLLHYINKLMRGVK